ncbi:unnamed protein product [Taenia asiatica]|uniref:PDZ domain-containing protein n=1 Tax=Taenia asiatica TaxID=60517 RepID=A0A158R788_TAEAS|nr:unnamed protein product [Taenia asiatica]
MSKGNQISFLSRITQNSSKSSSNKFFTNLHPLISKLRPSRPDDRNCLAVLNETWSEIGKLLTRATEERYSDAQELYDILSNDFVRELLVAVNGIGNCCYATYADQNIASTPVYVERNPFFMEGEDETNDSRSNLDRPFSMSSLPQDNEPPKSSRNQDIKCPSEGGQQPHPPSTLSSISTTWELLKTLSCTSSTNLHHRDPSTNKFPNEPANNRFPHHGLERRAGEAGSKHSALPFHVENSLPKPGMLRTVYINRSLPGEPLGITLATYGSSQMPTRSASLLSLLGRQTQREATKGPPKIVIQRIIVGSLADKEGKLFPGDELIELDGVAATSLEAVQRAMVDATQKNVLQMIVKTPGIGQLKAYILSRNHPEHKVYIRCLFKYDPLKDTLLPNGNLGIAFKNGDVLELVDSQDFNWWQVRRLGTPHFPVGLVPSQTLQERRQAFNQQACRWKDRICEDRLPRSSIFTGPGIPGLPEDNRSVFSRVTNSILSVASPESAVRLARPPSVCSSLQHSGVASKGDLGGASGGRWRYEKRKTKQLTKPSLSPPCSSVSSEIGGCNLALSASLPSERDLVSKAAVVRLFLICYKC